MLRGSSVSSYICSLRGYYRHPAHVASPVLALAFVTACQPSPEVPQALAGCCSPALLLCMCVT